MWFQLDEEAAEDSGAAVEAADSAVERKAVVAG